jgi:alginate O-acetyltransferase complex protein AlgI
VLFNSVDFLVFFPLVTAGYFLLPQRFRWIHLLLASCYFYMVFVPEYILILGFTILIDFIAGIMIARSEGALRKRYLLLSIFSNLAILFVFKYYDFFRVNVNALTGSQSVPAYNILLPIGLSFHTFQSLSYIFEVYRGAQAPVTHFGRFALFVMYYPQLVCGPIERPANLLHQFLQKKRFLFSRFLSGATLMLWGFVKKLVVADRLAYYVDAVWKDPAGFGGPYLLIGAYFFAWQIYCDFSGYTDIARGASRIMGIRLMKNFDLPFFAVSTSELWRRWHISLTSWFRDYVYIPMGGSRVARHRALFNVLLVCTLSGLWHGANWTYVLWGFWVGLVMVVSQLTQGLRDGFMRLIRLEGTALRTIIGTVITFQMFSISAILFRSTSLDQALFIFAHIPDLSLRMPIDVRIPYDLKTGLAVLAVFIGVEFMLLRRIGAGFFRKKKIMILHVLMLSAILTAGVLSKNSFIYFQF